MSNQLKIHCSECKSSYTEQQIKTANYECPLCNNLKKTYLEEWLQKSKKNQKRFDENYFSLEIASLIYKTMEAKRISVSLLSERTGISIETLESYLDGNKNPRIHTLVKIFSAMGEKIEIKIKLPN